LATPVDGGPLLLREDIADTFFVQQLPVVAIDPDQFLADNVHQGFDQGLAIAAAV
jgi:hypothetical protein